jgi:putative restriction endonuclease
MQGFIANTDLDWHGLLLQRQRAGGPLDEANFWKPSEQVTFKALKPGEPLLFRLKAKIGKIGGFGFFEGFSTLPVWLAWETFGLGNGVPSRAAFEERLVDIRRRNRMEERAELRVGCVLLYQPVMFEPEEYVDLPSDWKHTTQTGKGYDLARGEGARMGQR